MRQREVDHAHIRDVVDSLIAELHADMPAPRSTVLETVGKQAVAAGD